MQPTRIFAVILVSTLVPLDFSSRETRIDKKKITKRGRYDPRDMKITRKKRTKYESYETSYALYALLAPALIVIEHVARSLS